MRVNRRSHDFQAHVEPTAPRAFTLSVAFEKGETMFTKKGRGLLALRQLVAGIIGLIALGISPAFGQGFTAAISGTVRDVSGASVPAAAITVKHIETGL